MSQIDPAWAWTEYKPSDKQPWNRAAAAHLYRRAGFGASADELDEATKKTPGEIVEKLLDPSAETAEYRAEITDLSNASLATNDAANLSAWWVYRLLTTPSQLLEKTTLFWHGHFATSAAKVEDPELMHTQNELLRKYALGDFPQLLLEISRDPAMLVYLDSVTNRKAHPNENYAREIMELFCLGEGNYSENDIRELARCFTGWEIKRKKFRFNRYQHDTGSKTIFDETGKFGGEDGVRIVAGRDSAPRFIVKKMIRYFVFDEPEPSADLIEPLARTLRENDMQLGPLVRRILTSNLFFSERAIGRKVRSPVELAIGFLRTLEGSTNSYELANELRKLGHGLFYPPNVKGWDGGRTWINSSTLLGRSNLIRKLIDSNKTRYAGGSLNDFLAARKLKTPKQIVDWLHASLFAVPIPDSARDRVVGLLKGERRDRNQRLGEAVHALCTLPEFQLG